MDIQTIEAMPPWLMPTLVVSAVVLACGLGCCFGMAYHKRWLYGRTRNAFLFLASAIVAVLGFGGIIASAIIHSNTLEASFDQELALKYGATASDSYSSIKNSAKAGKAISIDTAEGPTQVLFRFEDGKLSAYRLGDLEPLRAK